MYDLKTLQKEIDCKGIEEFVKQHLIQESIMMNGDNILRQNERDLLKEIYENSDCQLIGCHEKAIKSHFYPNAFLKQTMGNDAKWINLMDSISNTNSFTNSFSIKKLLSDVKTKAATYPLFCQTHDSEIFKRIEINDLDIDLESYLYLYSYRFFMCEYFKENLIYKPIYKFYLDKTYSRKINEISEKRKKDYLFNKFKNSQYSNNRYSIENFDIVKGDFDKIFENTQTPTKEDFEKYFSIKHFRINCSMDFLAFGCTAFSTNKIDGHLPSIYSLIPTKDNKSLYFTIVMPKREVEPMNDLIVFFEKEYEKFKNKEKNDFLINLETRLLELSENILVSPKLYEFISGENLLEDFCIAYNILALSRLLGKTEYLENAAKCIKKLKLITLLPMQQDSCHGNENVGSLSSNTQNESEIRKNMINDDVVECIVSMLGQLFYSTGIPVSLWIMRKGKSDAAKCKVLVIDARNLGFMVDRKVRDLSREYIELIATTYHKWINGNEYQYV